MTSPRYQASGPAVVVTVTASFLRAVVTVLWWVVWPVARWYWRLLCRAWHHQQHRRTLARSQRALRLSRRQRRRITNRHYDTADPELVLRSLWWCLWVIAHDIPPVRLAEQMRTTDRAWADAVGYVAAQAYTIPTRHPQEITAAAWATELRALHGQQSLLPTVQPTPNRRAA